MRESSPRPGCRKCRRAAGVLDEELEDRPGKPLSLQGGGLSLYPGWTSQRQRTLDKNVLDAIERAIREIKL
jgi:hypothetical protein